LTYLIPTRILTKSALPSAALLDPYPELARLFLPLASAIKRGNLYSYDLALSVGEEFFVKRRIYLTLERAREICLRNLFRKVFKAAGFDAKSTPEKPVRRTALDVDDFVAAMRLSLRGPDGRLAEPDMVDRDEVECLMANAFYKVSDYFIILVRLDVLPGCDFTSHPPSHTWRSHLVAWR
jgi:hypothetical protein